MDTLLGRRRLARQGLDGPGFAEATVAVRHMGALQAQDPAQALWAIGARVPGATLEDVERAFAERKLVRTWPLRGTLHTVPAEDAAWMVALSAPRQWAASRARRAQLGLDEAQIAYSQAVAREVLRGGRVLTRPALLAAWEAAGLDTGGQRGYHLIWYAAHAGLLALGPAEGKQPTIVGLADWAPDPRRLEGDEALGELARRYFSGHGPATVQDFAWWAGQPLGVARRGLEAARDALAPVAVGAREGWVAADDSGAPADTRVQLLPGFDEFLLGYAERGEVLAPEDAPAVVPGNNGMFKAMVVVDGAVAGTWGRTIGARALTIEVRWFRPIAGLEAPLHEAAERVARFYGRPLILKA